MIIFNMSPKKIIRVAFFIHGLLVEKNYLLFLIGVITIVAGYVLMYLTADIVWAPVVLVIGYCVIIPISIMIK